MDNQEKYVLDKIYSLCGICLIASKLKADARTCCECCGDLGLFFDLSTSPPACNITCPMGHVNADCDTCMCEDATLHGKVSLEDGSPAADARVYLQAKKLKLLTMADNRGMFRIPGVCPDGKNTLKIKKAKYATATVTVPESNRKNLAIQVQLHRSGSPKEEGCRKLYAGKKNKPWFYERRVMRWPFPSPAGKPYVFRSPEDKARRAGQSVSFCCDARGSPAPNRYLW